MKLVGESHSFSFYLAFLSPNSSQSDLSYDVRCWRKIVTGKLTAESPPSGQSVKRKPHRVLC